MSPLHAARAGAGGAWCLGLAAVPLTCEHPVVLAAVLGVEILAAFAAGIWPHLRTVLLWGVPFAIVVALINALVTRSGTTILVRGWIDITLEALAYGGVLGLRLLAIFGAAAFLSAVDPDELLRGMRRASPRAGVTAALAVRLFPVLRRDAQRLGDAQRCLPGVKASRVAVLHAVTTGALDRATDVAATLEVRGFGTARRPPRRSIPWSRHDLAFAAAAAGFAALTIGGLFGAWGTFDPYPRLEVTTSAATLVAIALLAVCALAPFADRRGIAR
jgi:energy-coupling factor transport system permease protein